MIAYGRKELDYYADEYSKNGLHGTCGFLNSTPLLETNPDTVQWYRTRELNYNEEKTLDLSSHSAS